MKEYLSDIKEHFKGRWSILALLMPGLLCLIYYTSQGNLSFAAIIGILPLCLILVATLIYRPVILFIILFCFNYTIMGAIRYFHYPIPISVTMDALLLFLLFSLFLQIFKKENKLKKEVTPFLLLYSIWIIFCLIQLFNNTCGIGYQYAAWFQEIRPLAFHSFFIILIFSLIIRKQKDIHYFLYLWGAFIILASIKGYWQRNHGFDPNEWAWLLSGGARTHLISTGVRYFSFFTDAANYGSNMAFSLVTFSICCLYEDNKKRKVIWAIVAIASGYSMSISGTRSAVFVAIAGFMLFTLISKNLKLFLFTCIFLTCSVGILKYTTIGDSNRVIRRMRTAFDPQDASLQVRLNNQKAIKAYMKEAPWGIGIGVGPEEIPTNNKYWIVSITPPDSTLVYIWMRTGIVGIILFLLVLVTSVIMQCYIILFKIKDKRLRGILTAFTCGTACMIVAAYGNNIYHQYPNNLLIFGLQTIVFMGPYLDKQIIQEKERASIEQEIS